MRTQQFKAWAGSAAATNVRARMCFPWKAKMLWPEKKARTTPEGASCWFSWLSSQFLISAQVLVSSLTSVSLLNGESPSGFSLYPYSLSLSKIIFFFFLRTIPEGFYLSRKMKGYNNDCSWEEQHLKIDNIKELKTFLKATQPMHCYILFSVMSLHFNVIC